MVERTCPEIPIEFLKRIRDQSKYLEGDLSKYVFQHGLRKGMMVLELGSCIGLHSRKIAEAIYPGTVFSLEKRHEYLLYQKRQLHRKKNNIILVEGDASALPLANGLCDFVYSRFLFQHLRNPQIVLIEIRRVLKRGGKILIVDSDDYYETFYPPVLSAGNAYSALAKLQGLEDGDRFVGRKLFTYLVDAGYRNVGVKVIPILQFGKQKKEVVTKDVVPMFEEEYYNILRAQFIDKEELDLAISSMLDSVKRKNSFYFGLVFVASASK